ncbi:hypothetical protein DSECCO2_283140 [anaerobic digester metagenome]
MHPRARSGINAALRWPTVYPPGKPEGGVCPVTGSSDWLAAIDAADGTKMERVIRQPVSGGEGWPCRLLPPATPSTQCSGKVNTTAADAVLSWPEMPRVRDGSFNKQIEYQFFARWCTYNKGLPLHKSLHVACLLMLNPCESINFNK